MTLEPRRVAVLLSGGVDSAVAAALLLHQGYQVTGLHLRMVDGEPLPPAGEFPSPPADVRGVAEALGIPLVHLDLRRQFSRVVIRPFVETYAQGRTPNPCVGCNPDLKFASAVGFAQREGIGQVASGHYARLAVDAEGVCRLRRARDASRDQSYFLHRLPGRILARLIFPLGEMTKGDVRRVAAELNLPVARKPDSQEICFLGGRSPLEFLSRAIPTCARRTGPLVDGGGAVLGYHDGIHQFTVGQRRRLGLAKGRPLYVVGIDPGDGSVRVGDDRDCYHTAFRIVDTHWAGPPPGPEPLRVLVKVRQRHEESPARIWCRGQEATVIFDKPQRAITPGQSAVCYDGDVVLGGGIIKALGA
jgi:tRNA-specific 2-thiouridylase